MSDLFLRYIAPERIHMRFPVEELLRTACFYPSCDLDGGVVKDLNERAPELGIRSFVYADHLTSEADFLERLNGFRYYRVLCHRPVELHELVPEGRWTCPPGIPAQRYSGVHTSVEPFQHWAVYERLPDAPPARGPLRWSLLYINAEALAVYHGLFRRNRMVPKALALIEPGHRFGGNWTSFWDPEEPFHRMLQEDPRGMPQLVYCGGRFGDVLPWPDYTEQRLLRPYYHQRPGEVRLALWDLADREGLLYRERYRPRVRRRTP
jgi:hypothetical protein